VIRSLGEQAGNDLDRLWVTDAQFPKMELRIPADTRNMLSVDDRRMISGFAHVL
jgi:hypothetical protein